MKNIVFLIIVIVLSVSCETSFEPTLPENGPEIVIYSFFRPGAKLSVDVFHTTPILAQDRLARITDLKIRLMKNGEFAEELSVNYQGKYLSNQIPLPNDHFSFEVNYNNKQVLSESHVPLAVQIEEANVSKVLTDIDIGKYGYPAEITFADPLNFDNYYAVEVLIENCDAGCNPQLPTGNLNELLVEEVKVNTSGNTDVEIGGGPERIDGLKYIYFNDEGFDGKSITIKFFIIPTYLNFERNQNVLIKVVLKSITKEFYEYLRTSNFQEELEDGGNFSEPVQIATNFQNGLGIFAGYNYSIYTIVP